MMFGFSPLCLFNSRVYNTCSVQLVSACWSVGRMLDFSPLCILVECLVHCAVNSWYLPAISCSPLCVLMHPNLMYTAHCTVYIRPRCIKTHSGDRTKLYSVQCAVGICLQVSWSSVELFSTVLFNGRVYSVQLVKCLVFLHCASWSSVQ